MIKMLMRMIGAACRQACAPAGAGVSRPDCNTPATFSASLLLSRLARHADSQFGRDHFFHEIRTPADFRKRVPIGGYDRHEPYIDRVRQGDTNALFGRGHRSPDVRDDLGHDQPAQDDSGHHRRPSTIIARAGRSGASWRSTPIAR